MGLIREVLTYVPVLVIGLVALYYVENRNKPKETGEQDQSTDSAPVEEAGLETELENTEENNDLPNQYEDWIYGFNDVTGNIIYQNPESGRQFELDPQTGEPLYDERELLDPNDEDVRETATVPAMVPTAGTSRTGVQRTVGAKKTKSLARKDQRRAYNEFVRQQAEMDRQEQEEFNQRYGSIIEEEKAARLAREAAAADLLKERQQTLRDEERKTIDLIRENRSLLENLAPGSKLKLTDESLKKVASTISGGFVVANGQWFLKPSNKQIESLAGLIRSKGRLTMREICDYLELEFDSE